jgi:esterase/lipase superfamily enzyme
MSTETKTNSTKILRLALLSALIVLVAGCARTLMQTPDFYVHTATPLFDGLAPELQGNTMEVLYVTDRLPEPGDSEALVEYGYERSPSLVLGAARVRIDQQPAQRDAAFPPTLELTSVRELVQLPPTPYPYQVRDNGRIETDPGVSAELERANEKARQDILKRLALTPRKEIIVQVHGVATDFDEAVLALAETWHFLGREGVPIAYTWPAGRRGLFFYTKDRESGEFTLLHLKQFLRFLTDVPEVERIHVLAHSRGTDIFLSALRELVIEHRAAGLDPRQELKIENLVLIAADIDLEVALQRISGEAMSPAIGQVTIYANADDEALSVSSSLFGSQQRVGSLRPGDVPDIARQEVERIGNVDLIVCEDVGGGFFRHGYYSDPTVSSDILMLLRYGWRPGEGQRVNLEAQGDNIWRIP